MFHQNTKPPAEGNSGILHVANAARMLQEIGEVTSGPYLTSVAGITLLICETVQASALVNQAGILLTYL